jgi:hypothetical protein
MSRIAPSFVVIRLQAASKGIRCVIPVGLEIFLITPSKWDRYFLVPYRRTANCVESPVHQAVSVHLQELYIIHKFLTHPTMRCNIA